MFFRFLNPKMKSWRAFMCAWWRLYSPLSPDPCRDVRHKLYIPLLAHMDSLAHSSAPVSKGYVLYDYLYDIFKGQTVFSVSRESKLAESGNNKGMSGSFLG